MGNLFAELKRRHIYRVAAAYAVVAWVLIQLVNNVAPALRLPEWAPTLVIVLLLVGFPITVLIAWMRELAPADGTTTQAPTSKLDWVLIGALVVVIALVSYEQISRSTGTAQRASVARAQLGGISIAVLPFANLSGDVGQEFFSDGMTEEITSALAKVPDLQVVARESAFQFKGEKKDMRAVGRALGARYLIEGSVRKAADRVRITAQLVEAENGLNVWTDTYDRELKDIFATQSDIAQAVAAALRVPLGLKKGDTLVSSRSANEASYEDYLRAKSLVRARGLERITEATALLEQAVARDPNYAPGWALLAQAYAITPIYHPSFRSGAVDQIRPIIEAALPKAEAAAKRAVQLDPENPEGYSSEGLVYRLRGNWLLAADLYSRALALDPHHPDALHNYSEMLAGLGYTKQALPMRQRLQVLEPFVPIFSVVTASVMWANGQTDAATAMIEPLLKGTGQFALTLARIEAAQGHYLKAADILATLPPDLYLPGTVEAAVRLLRAAPAPAASPQELPKLGNLGFVYVSVGAPDRVFEYHEDFQKVGYGIDVDTRMWASDYASIRKTERFKALMRKTGLVDYWRTRGWPDLCRPVGADDFVCD